MMSDEVASYLQFEIPTGCRSAQMQSANRLCLDVSTLHVQCKPFKRTKGCGVGDHSGNVLASARALVGRELVDENVVGEDGIEEGSLMEVENGMYDEIMALGDI